MKRIIMASITAVVVIAVLAGTLIPILDDATATQDTFDNSKDAYAYMTKLDSTTAYTFEWDHTDPTVATVNGKEVNMFKGTVFCSTGAFLIRFNQDSTGYYLQVVPNGAFALGSAYSAGDGAADLSLTLENGTVTGVKTLASDSSTTTNTAAVTDGFAISADGDYVMKKPTQSAYMNADSEIYAMGLSYYGGTGYNGIYITGDTESVTIDMFTPSPANATFSNVSINKSEVESHIDLYKFDSITFLATVVSDPTVTANLTYNYVIVPAEVTAERAVHFTDGENAIFNAIPVMIIIALLLGVVALVLRSRMD